MTKRIIKHSLIVMVLSMALSFVSVGNIARAEGWWQTASDGGLNQVGSAYGQSSGIPADAYDIRLMAARIIRVVLELMGLIFLVLIIFAGFKWMTAGGDEEKITESKKLLTNSIIGLIIIFAAWSIATFVFYQLQYAITGVKPITWSF